MANVLLTAWWLGAPFVGAYGLYVLIRVAWALLDALFRGEPRP